MEDITKEALEERGFEHRGKGIGIGYWNLYLKRDYAIQYVNVPKPQHPILLSLGDAFRIVPNAYTLEDLDQLIKLFS